MEGANGYTLYFQLDGKKTLNSLSSLGSVYGITNTNEYRPSGSTYSTITNTDADKWYARVYLSRSEQNGAAKGRIAIVASPIRQDINPSIGYSDDVSIN